ncbi:acyl dehydratase [Sulfitobacter sp. S190]|uniref:acyl dehydratase n=1 Tax=Sulfitobacter sp. S190 TaxID=2867022 RepID=UPI0021A520AA|nr:acyl dehydratase [Sulfitobacter sp. S190]UWR22753.1 acyl dehydratase [Sulfitobacter sp. S190]
MQHDTTTPVRQRDLIDPARADALMATLGLSATFREGDPLPPFVHNIYFWDAQPPAQLGRDGHPRVGGLIPDTGLPRRMWAGGRLLFDAPLRAGIVAERHSVCESAVTKRGRTGPLAFVTLRHEIRQAGQTVLREWQDLVYRQDPGPEAQAPVPPRSDDAAQDTRVATFDATQLFRYSALTFNGHRIHYDRAYAKSVEGYAGLVVHGPLLAQLLLLWAHETDGSVDSFRFRATAPLMDFESATLCRDGPRLWVRGPDGRLCMTAQLGD